MKRNITSSILLVLLTWLAWTSWQPPAVIPDPQSVRLAIPESMHAGATLWRVVTRRMVWQQAAKAMHKRLEEAGLRVTPISRKEDVELHAFDDARTFSNHNDAVLAKQEWKKRGLDASITKSEHIFGIALGRLYLAAYARRLQERLKKNAMKFNYDRRIVHIPTWRFTFPASTHHDAEKLWQRIQILGFADPALIPETQFMTLYNKQPIP